MVSNKDTNSITDLISQFPIFSSLITYLDIWDLIQLSRTSVTIRYLCHSFNSDDPFEKARHIAGTNIRKSLRIGQHKTATWRLYKSLTQKRCQEPDHTRGVSPLGCKLCSKPVCFACIVKHSFAKHESTFLLRGRALCKQCFNTGNPHSEHISVQGSAPLKMNYTETSLCVCTSHDGVLCLDCKERQNQDSSYVFRTICAGAGCGQSLDGNSSGVRVCLWCNCILPTTSQKQQYETVHGYAFRQEQLISVRGASRTFEVAGIPSSPSADQVNRPRFFPQNSFETRDSTSSSSPEPSPLPNSADIPAYSQHPMDMLPDYQSIQLHVQ